MENIRRKGLSRCRECQHWFDHSTRVYARLSRTIARNLIELRECKFIPLPTVRSEVTVYTDEDYYCSGFKKVEK